MLYVALRSLRSRFRSARLPAAARAQRQRDLGGLPAQQHSPDDLVAGALQWLCRAQDHSASADGGVARDFSLLTGWSASYPETTGYIAATILEQARLTGSPDLLARARRMLDWLVRIQLPSGGFQGGTVDLLPVVPVVFNTGQILMGLAAGEKQFGVYREALARAADWLVEVQDRDGCWRKGASPFALQGEKTYDLHAAWGLIEAESVIAGRGYGKAAMANVHWAMKQQVASGWMDKCCLTDAAQPLTHTLGYALRGLVEAWRYSHQAQVLEAARRLADGLLGALRPDGFLPGLLAADWSARAEWACLTGSVQVAHCWMQLFQDTGDERYLEAARRVNRYVGRSVRFDGPADVRGAVAGSFPIDGGYCTYQYPAWAAKFMIDSLTLQNTLDRTGS